MNPPSPQAAALALFPDWSLANHLEAWRKLHKGKSVIGQTFIAPDGQAFKVTGRLFWRYAGRKRPAISIVWQSACRLCGQPYTFNTPWHSGHLVRTCKAHRGKSKAQCKTPLRDLVTRELDAARLAGSISHESLIAACVAQMARGIGQDTRRTRIVRALQAMIDSGALPQGVTMQEDSFICK
ncbi:MAG: hypothetical protein KGL39_42830 [Patescibacteria group bacterium]|nr:hypothetical protein [Patescibacteria group bacterium]